MARISEALVRIGLTTRLNHIKMARLPKKIRKILLALGLVFLLLAGILILALPYLVKQAANYKLHRLPGYEGHISDVDLRLFQGELGIDKFILKKKEQKEADPYISADRIFTAIRWREAFKGRLVGDVLIDRLVIHVVAAVVEREKEEVKEEPKEKPVSEMVEQVFPIKINRFEIRDGLIRYRDDTVDPPIHVYADRFSLIATNLTTDEHADNVVGEATQKARIMDSGQLETHLQFNPLARPPVFNMDFTLEQLSLPKFNAFFRHYAGVDIQTGRLNLYSEVASKEGRYEGYIKPLIYNLNVLNTKQEDLSLDKKIKEWAIDVVGEIFENQPTVQVGAQVPFSGTFENPHVDVWTAAFSVLRNAFIEALSPRLSGSRKSGEPKIKKN